MSNSSHYKGIQNIRFPWTRSFNLLNKPCKKIKDCGCLGSTENVVASKLMGCTAQHHGDEVWKSLKVVIPPIPNYPTSKDMTNFAKIWNSLYLQLEETEYGDLHFDWRKIIYFSYLKKTDGKLFFQIISISLYDLIMKMKLLKIKNGYLYDKISIIVHDN